MADGTTVRADAGRPRRGVSAAAPAGRCMMHNSTQQPVKAEARSKAEMLRLSKSAKIFISLSTLLSRDRADTRIDTHAQPHTPELRDGNTAPQRAILLFIIQTLNHRTLSLTSPWADTHSTSNRLMLPCGSVIE